MHRDETRRQHLAELMSLFDLQRFDGRAMRELTSRLTPAAQIDPQPKRLALIAIDDLRQRRVMPPPASVLPRIRITDLLLEVDRWTGFSACFTHQRTGRAAKDRTALLATVLADGINLGLTRMAETCSGVTMRQLAWVHDWHIREETYTAALACLVDAHRVLPLSSVWGDGTSSSSDGQYFRSGSQGSGLSEVNARHGNEPGVAFYTHISDQFGPFHTKVIAAAASEAPHVLDGLLSHRSGLQIREHYTDTGGATDHVFGLCPFLGFRFAPRLRDIKDRRIYLLPGMTVDPAVEPLVGGVLDTRHAEANWDELVRLAVSIRAGTTSASAMLRRLAAYPRQNGLAVALREVGRLERTLFTLDWIWTGDAEPERSGFRPLRRLQFLLAA